MQFKQVLDKSRSCDLRLNLHLFLSFRSICLCHAFILVMSHLLCVTTWEWCKLSPKCQQPIIWGTAGKCMSCFFCLNLIGAKSNTRSDNDSQAQESFSQVRFIQKVLCRFLRSHFFLAATVNAAFTCCLGSLPSWASDPPHVVLFTFSWNSKPEDEWACLTVCALESCRLNRGSTPQGTWVFHNN